MRKKFLIVVASLALLSGTACRTSKQNKTAGKDHATEQKAVSDGFARQVNSQPVPVFDWSQVRQTLIDVEGAQATGALSTTAFYLEGIGLIGWCPSIGSPVASTAQLSSSKQFVDLPGDHTNSLVEVDQGEPTGIYPGGSSGTWTVCLDDNGKKFAHYWEGYVSSDIGVNDSYPAEKRVRITSPTFNFTDPPKK